jgi:molybdate transport system substrate-binding protein
MRRTLAVAAALMLAFSACSSDAAADRGASGVLELTVFAASSLTAIFGDELGPSFEEANPGVTVVFNFGASDSLAGQIQSEGSADVFASASGVWMDAVARDPGVAGRTDFARNRLVLVTPPDDPASISSIDDLATPGVQLVLGAPGVPVGDYAREALDAAGILPDAEANIVSNEEDNASVVAKVAAGEADAAIVYASDVSGPAGNDLRSIEIPDPVNVIATYPIAVVAGARQETLAVDFVDYVTGTDGRATLAAYGFEAAG